MKILLTGAAGFIGSHTADALLARGDEVVGLDNFNDFYDPALKRGNLAGASASTRFRLVEGDIEDRALIDRLVADERPDAIVHLAARAGVRPSIQTPELYERTNGLGTLNVLQAAAGIPVLLASSSSVYGASSRLPFAEDDPVAGPVSPYAATKRANELMAHAFHAVHDLPVWCLRFFTVYGPRQRPEMAIAKFIRLVSEGAPVPLFGDGSSRRDYTFIEDIVSGTIRALDLLRERGGFEILNLGGERTTTLAELVDLVEEAVGRPAIRERRPEQAGDVPATWADVTKARRVLGWEPKTPPREGIARQVAWWRAR